MEKKIEEKLEKVLKGLEKEGFKVRRIEDIKCTVEFLGQTDLLEGRNIWAIKFNKNGRCDFETTWSNQTITKEWIEKASRILNMLEGEFK